MRLKNSHCSLFDILLSDKEYDLARLLIAHGVDVNGKPNDYQGYLNDFGLWVMERMKLSNFIERPAVIPQPCWFCLAYSRMPAEKAGYLSSY